MGPTFEALRPPFRKLDDANKAVLPFVREAAPILKNQVRPFARAAQPVPARTSAARPRTSRKANPDLTTAFRELNRLFNIGAYNPGGTEGISTAARRPAPARRRSARATRATSTGSAGSARTPSSLFSTADALGPIRRAYLLNLNCAAFTAGARQAGMGDTEVDGLAHLFGALGACSAP